MRGFTLIELLIATAITLVIAGAIAAATPAARAAIDRVPAELEMDQRGRIALDTLSQVLRAAVEIWPAMPDESGAFSELSVVIPVPTPAQGVLAVDQAGPGGSMTLAEVRCPSLKGLCGFTAGMTAIVSDAADIEVFTVGSTNQPERTLTPAASLSRPYAAGTAIRQVEQYAFRLDAQSSLVRVTAAAAVQPIVDALVGLSFVIDGDRVDVSLVVRATAERLRGVIADRAFRTSITRRNRS